MTTIYKHSILLISLLVCLASVSIHAQPAGEAGASGDAPKPGRAQISRLGDPVPPLTIQEWIKGGPVRVQPGTDLYVPRNHATNDVIPVRIEPGTNLYVLVFCSLTRASDLALTNLSDLEKKYRDKGVVTVAISPGAPEELKEFVQLKRDEIDFMVAADDLPDRTTRAYQQTFGQMLLPRAYLVKDGKLLWHGHPLTDGLGEVVDAITSGNYDPDQIRKSVLTREQLEEYVYFARQEDTNAVTIGRLIIRFHADDAAVLCQLASKIATDTGIKNRDVSLANDALDRAGELSTTNTTDIAVTRAILLYQTGQQEEGLARAKQALASARNPDAKDEAQTVVQAMEAALAAAKANQATPATATNQVTNAP